jgi:hypothetical protein
MQRVHARAPQLRPELLEEPSQRQNFRPYVLVEREEFRFELVADFNEPGHGVCSHNNDI